MEKNRIVCLSHKEDVDGISSASLIRKAFGGETKLVDYPGLMSSLEQLQQDDNLKKLFICDLGLSKQNQDQFVEFLSNLRKKKVTVTYIDHHDLDKKIIKKMENLKVKLIHDVNECTTAQVYKAFKSKLDDHSPFIGAMAAVTDYMEDRPIGSKLLQKYDRQFALLEATVLTFTIASHQKDEDFLLYLVDELVDSKYPHQIPNAFEYARISAERISEVIQKVRKNMKTMKNLAYMEVTDSGASMAVNFVLGMSGKEVGVSYKLREEQGIYAVSIRGSKSCKIHLGRIVNDLAAEMEGSGGGHDKACGAVVPRSKINTFLKKFNSKLS